jgi:hypothetical protein
MRHVFLVRASSLLSKKVLKWSAARERVLGQPENVQIPEIEASFKHHGEFL